MNLEPIATLLETANLGTKGETIFLNMLPATQENAILLRSPLTGTPIDYELPGFYQTDFQVIVRVPAGSYADGEALAYSVMNALTMNNAQVGNMHFNYCRPRTEPVPYPLSTGNLVEFNVKYDCCFVKVA